MKNHPLVIVTVILTLAVGAAVGAVLAQAPGRAPGNEQATARTAADEHDGRQAQSKTPRAQEPSAGTREQDRTRESDREQAREQERSARDRARAVRMLSGPGPRIGVTVEDLTPEELAKVSGARGGVRITRVDSDSPAAEAGLREGDLVVEFEGEPVRSTRQFARLVQETPSGHRVTLGIVRGRDRQTIEVTPEAPPMLAWGVDGDRIGEQVERRLREIEPRLRGLEPRLREFRFDVPEDFHFDFDVDVFPWAASPRARLGVQLDELTPQLAEYFGARDGGVLVTSVAPGTPAQAAGLRAGDVITSIDGAAVRDREDVVDELRDKEGAVTIGLVRDRKETSVKATLEPRPPRRLTARRPA